jgi:3-oxoacyl-[acyl-carrier protein] reductase
MAARRQPDGAPGALETLWPVPNPLISPMAGQPLAIYPDLCGRVALVTGAGRSDGIGAAICRAFADQGCNVFFTYRSSGNLQDPDEESERNFAARLLSDLRGRGVLSECAGIDLAAAQSADMLLERAYKTFGALSILVNNAVHSSLGSFETLDAEGLDAHYFVNVRAAVLLSVGFAKRYSEGTGGRIINITSGQDLSPMPGELAYVASKAAIAEITQSLAKEVAHKGITVNAVDPGPTDTGWMTQELKAQLVTESRFGRLGEPKDAANLIVFLSSKAGEWITGEVIHSRGI